VKLSNFNVGIDQPLFLIAGPCVIESEDMTLSVADELKNICIKLDIPFIFKSSFDKANRSSNSTFRGFGMEEGLRILEKVKDQFEVPVLTDIHTIEQVKPVSEMSMFFKPLPFCADKQILLLLLQNPENQ